MAENRAELIEHYRAMRRELLAAIDGVSDAQICEPTLDGWSVKDHLLHIALWDEIRAAEVERISAGRDSLWRMSEEQVDQFAGVLYALRRDCSAPQAKWEVEKSHQRLLDAITVASERGLDASLYGEAGVASDHEAEHVLWINRWRGERGY